MVTIAALAKELNLSERRVAHGLGGHGIRIDDQGRFDPREAAVVLGNSEAGKAVKRLTEEVTSVPTPSRS